MSQAAPEVSGLKAGRTERFYLPELDVLRFFAFFGVFVFHLPLSGFRFFWRYGWLGDLGIAGVFGVDLFFTLSGYLITRLLLKERDETGDINLKAFYARRTLRIWPLYYFAIGLSFLLTQLPASITTVPLVGNMFAPMPASSYFFLAVFLFNFDFANGSASGPLTFVFPLWTISVEEQFYLVWPWFARYLPRKRIVVVPIVMIAVACAVRAISIPLKVHTLVWNNTFTRLDPISIGILIALLPRFDLRTPTRLALAAFGIASWLFAVRYCGLSLPVGTLAASMGYPAVALGSGAFLLATLGAKSFTSGSAPARSLVYLGKISYGLYVYNQIAKTFTQILFYRIVLPAFAAAGWPEWSGWSVYVIVVFGLNVVMAAASYRWLEAPFLCLKERFTRVPSRTV